MIAEVYPILKLPRKCAYFDYELGFNLVVAPGDLVRVPFKGREVLGLVRGVKDVSGAKKLIRISSVARTNYVTSGDIRRYERIAECLVQSVSTLLHTVFPTTFFDGPPSYVQSRSSSHVGALDIPILERCLSEISLNKSVAISGDRDIGFALAYALRRKQPHQMLILLPRERDAELLVRYVDFGASASVLTGKTPLKDRVKIFEAWRTGELQTLIGTRNAALLPAKHCANILILEAGNGEYLNARRNPRFDAREAAKLLAHDHDAHVVSFDPLPRLEELVRAPLVMTIDKPAADIIINLGSADEITPEPLLSDSVLTGIERALHSQKRVLIFLNRKGVAKRLQCGKCKHIPLCGNCGQVPVVRHDDLVCPSCQTEMWIPDRCPACGQPKLGLRGIGGAKLVDNLQKLFPSATVGHIEKGRIEQPQADIVVATEYFFSSYLEPFGPKRFGLVADLAADISLHAGDFRGAEDTARKLHRLVNFAKRQGAQVLAQTWLPEILQPMLDLPSFVAAELELRQRYHLPPSQTHYLLEKAKFDDLSPTLQALARERDKVIELDSPLPQDLQQLPDTIKIQCDGTYAPSHESTSRT